MITDSVGWGFINVFYVILILRFTTALIEKLLILGVVVRIVFTWGNMEAIIPILLLVSASPDTHFIIIENKIKYFKQQNTIF